MARGMTSANRGAPWRDVVDRTLIKLKHSKGYGTARFTLSCGHQVHRKTSAGYPTRVRCTLCPTSNGAEVR